MPRGRRAAAGALAAGLGRQAALGASIIGEAAAELPGGPGVYGVRVYRGRYDGAEKFLIDVWWRAVLPPADDDEDFYGDLWS